MNRDLEAAAPGFAPDDPTDGRKPGKWESRYPDEALRRIRTEALYLAGHLALVPIGLFVVAMVDGYLRADFASAGSPTCFCQFAFAWLGGMCGGTLFSIKWLYHTVGKNMWNVDRRLWRFFTPHVSGGLGFAFVVLSSSRFLIIFDNKAFESPWVCFGLGFLVGYFSDSAMAKLTEVSQTLFGPTKRPSVHETGGTSTDSSRGST